MSDAKNNVQRFTADHVEIRELIDAYTDIVNRRNWNELPAIFTKDAVWIAGSPINMEWKQIQLELPKSVERMEVLIQTASSVRINVESDTQATATSYLTEVGRNKETKESIRAIGTYEDVIIKEDGVWKFKQRTFTLQYSDNQPLQGQLKDYKY